MYLARVTVPLHFESLVESLLGATSNRRLRWTMPEDDLHFHVMPYDPSFEASLSQCSAYRDIRVILLAMHYGIGTHYGRLYVVLVMPAAYKAIMLPYGTRALPYSTSRPRIPLRHGLSHEPRPDLVQ